MSTRGNGRGRTWTTGEKFEVLKYAIEGAEELSRKLGRSISSIKTMAQNINATKSYNKDLTTTKEYTTAVFCKDCIDNPKTCGKNVQECITTEDAKTYTKFHKIKDIEGSPDKVTVVWKKKKNSNKVEQVMMKLPFV
jgi:hypothetical protein